jgi:hypothetical protein
MIGRNTIKRALARASVAAICSVALSSGIAVANAQETIKIAVGNAVSKPPETAWWTRSRSPWLG